MHGPMFPHRPREASTLNIVPTTHFFFGLPERLPDRLNRKIPLKLPTLRVHAVGSAIKFMVSVFGIL
jgi:hypothetical protein